jgi:outer membrane protein TolC
VATGTSARVGNNWTGDFGLQKGFSTGSMLSITSNANRQTNSTTNRLNPFTSSTVQLSFTQPLMRGFGVNTNRRFIRIAENNGKTTALVFRQQAIATVNGVIRLYDDLVSLIEDVKVKEQTLTLAQRLYEDNRVAVDQGTLAPVELTRAQAQVAAARQDLTNSQGFERQQELILKTVLTRRDTADPAIRDARVVPTTPNEVPANETVRPIQDLIDEAFRSRPELEEARLQLQNSNISLAGSRNQILPQLDFVATAQNSGLAGGINPLSPANSAAAASGSPPVSAPGKTLGGIGTGLGQSLALRYPTYAIGLQLSLPLRNRVALADLARDEMQLRQWEVRFQQLENQVEAGSGGSRNRAGAGADRLRGGRGGAHAAGAVVEHRKRATGRRSFHHLSCSAIPELRGAGAVHRGGRPGRLRENAGRARTRPGAHAREPQRRYRHGLPRTLGTSRFFPVCWGVCDVSTQNPGRGAAKKSGCVSGLGSWGSGSRCGFCDAKSRVAGWFASQTGGRAERRRGDGLAGSG